MVLYLTSSFIPYQEIGHYEKKDLGECYGFFEDLRQEWHEFSVYAGKFQLRYHQA